MQLISTDKLRIIIGLGKTGLSCARYLRRCGLPFLVMDTREQPAGLPAFRQEFPDVAVYCGALSVDRLLEAAEIIVSPGVALGEPALQAAAEAGISLIGDIELFARKTRKPVIAITGSNAKSTVTTLVWEMARAAGLRAVAGGNLGEPVLDLPQDEEVDCYVLELSSFQLETTHSLKPLVSVVLNISEDHMDRYSSLQAYCLAKHRIHRGASHCVFNRADALTRPLQAEGQQLWSFGLDQPDRRGVGVAWRDGEQWLVADLGEPLMPVSQILLAGQHNLANVAAAFAIARAAAWDMPACADAVRHFRGLDHRCQWVAEKQGVRYYNDSKGTNVGATIAALEGLVSDAGNNIVLIAGGDGKGADFTAMSETVLHCVRKLVLIGRDAHAIASACAQTESVFAASMIEAVQLASVHAQPGDVVLLSPACASFDMFKGYDDRGRQFCAAVEAL